MGNYSMYLWEEVEFWDDGAGRVFRTQVAAIESGWLFRSIYEIGGDREEGGASGVGVGLTFVHDPNHENKPGQLLHTP